MNHGVYRKPQEMQDPAPMTWESGLAISCVGNVISGSFLITVPPSPQMALTVCDYLLINFHETLATSPRKARRYEGVGGGNLQLSRAPGRHAALCKERSARPLPQLTRRRGPRSWATGGSTASARVVEGSLSPSVWHGGCTDHALHSVPHSQRSAASFLKANH